MSCLWNYLAILESDNPDNWISRNNLDNVEPISRYIACVYFALAGLTTVGYGDIYAKTVCIYLYIHYFI